MPLLGVIQANQDGPVISVNHNENGNATMEHTEQFEPIAIVGMGCRWPGDIDEPSQLWEFLQAKRDAYSDFPADRINTDAFYHEKRDRPGSFYSRGGCFLQSPKDFDHTFFGINPQEARSIDPAQRKLLETVFEAFESSGTTLDELSGSKTGCFVGNFNYDHQLMQYRDAEYPEAYGISGGGLAILSNRINYVFNLKGPSMTLDTACSSSMYALHLACSAIHAGDCSSAVVAGSNLILTPECQIFSSALGAVSPSSRCHTFDAAADGYARADGVGALYIKRLQDAVTDRDPIRAIIRGTAINANGKTGGITRPSSDGQESAIRQAYERAAIDFSSTSYFECHGTGTPVGDPLEVAAIGRLFSHSRSQDDPLLLGSVKTNLGHSEPVSGIAGMMKVILSLEHDIIPPSVGINRINPEIDLRNDTLRIITESTPWPKRDHRIASVNSFGYGGSNAHVILEATESFFANSAYAMDTTMHLGISKPLDEITRSPQLSCISSHSDEASDSSDSQESFELIQTRESFLLVFSAHSAETLEKNMQSTSKVAKNYDTLDLAYSLGARRSCLPQRSFMVANCESLEDKLRSEKPIIQRVIKGQCPSLAFVFTGQGAQWLGMGSSLFQTFSSCRQTLATLDKYLQQLREPPVWLLQGEIAAAYSSGGITSQQAIILAYLRGKILQQNSREGAMLAVGLSEKNLGKILERELVNVVVACYNSPTSITLSGDTAEIMAIKEILDRKRCFARLLRTDGNAYHSPHMHDLGMLYADWIDHECASMLRDGVKKIEVPFISSVTGRHLSSKALTASYWRSNLESSVRFDQALSELLKTSAINICVEIGPHNALKGPIQEICRSMELERSISYVPTLIRNEDSIKNLVYTAGHLWLQNFPLDIQRVNSVDGADHDQPKLQNSRVGRVIADLPRYQWHYAETLLLENRWTREWRLRTHPRHDILGSQIPGLIKSSPTWRNVLRLKDLSWLQDHRIDGSTVFPAAGFLAMVVEAISQVFENNSFSVSDISAYKLEDVTFDKALVIPDDDHGVETFLNLTPYKGNNAVEGSSYPHQFTIYSESSTSVANESVRHAFGKIYLIVGTQEVKGRKVNKCLTGVRPKSNASSALCYQKFAHVGMGYGPSFRCLSDINVNNEITVAKLELEGAFAGESRYVIHPKALDSALQLCVLAAHSGSSGALKSPHLPFKISRMRLSPLEAKEKCLYATSAAQSSRSGTRSINSELVVTLDNQVIMHAKDIMFLSLQGANANAIRDKEPFSRMTWFPDIERLTTKTATALHPLVKIDHTAMSTRLDHLALHQLVQFFTEYRHFFEEGSKVPHLQRFLDWTRAQTDSTTQSGLPEHREILEYSIETRALIIQDMSEDIKAASSEARLSCHIYQNLPAILRGEKTGIQAALENDRLSAMYKDAHRVVEGNRRLASVVALATQKIRNAEILEVGAGTGSASREILSRLNGATIYRMYRKYAFTDITPSFLNAAESQLRNFEDLSYFTFNMEDCAAADRLKASYDIVTASNAVHASSDILQTLRNLRKVLRRGGKLILLEITEASLVTGLLLGTFSDFWKGGDDPNFPRYNGPFLSKSMWSEVLPQAGFSGLDFTLDDYEGQPSTTVIVATAVDEPSCHMGPPFGVGQDFCIVVRDTPYSADSVLASWAQSQACHPNIVSLTNNKPVYSKNLIICLEIEHPFFEEMSQAEWCGIQRLLTNADSAIWITKGGLMKGENPQKAMISGIARGLRTELSRLQLTIVDFDQNVDFAEPDVQDLIFKIAEQSVLTPSKTYDAELRVMNGIPYISRLLPDSSLNEELNQRVPSADKGVPVPFEEISGKRWRVNVGSTGIPQSLYCEESDCVPQSHDLGDKVEIDVKAMGLSHENVAGLLGKSQYAIFGDECSGVLSKVGSQVTNLAVGDRVFCPVFGECGDRAVVPGSWCQTLQPKDTHEVMAKMSLAFCTAIRGLLDLARLMPGESVLVYSALSPIGFAGLQIALTRSAKIFATVDHAESKDILTGLRPDIPRDHIFILSERDLSSAVLDLTEGRGVDVVLSNPPLDMVNDQWDCVAANGRFVNVRRCDDVEARRTCVQIPSQGISYTAFDLARLGESRSGEISDLMKRVHQLHIQGLIKPVPTQKFHAINIEAAFEICLEHPLSSSIVLDYEPVEGSIKFQRSAFQSHFDAEATYLLVGGLSDLGQIFSWWLVSRGAKHLTFLSRSGCSNDQCRAFVSKLQNEGIETDIIKGDVSSLEDVQRLVTSCKRAIKGVVHGALSLEDRLFENLTHSNFQSLIGTRVRGTLNLHSALSATNQPLDFFLLWSSYTAIFGTAGQSNYLATCAFMDAFARHRRSLGLPATSLDLSQILETGAIRREPAYASSLMRNGLYGNSEWEFLLYCDAAIANSKDFPGVDDVSPYDSLAGAQLLAGIEPAGLRDLDLIHPLEEMPWYNDPRFSHLIAATRRLQSSSSSTSTTTTINPTANPSSSSPCSLILTKLASLLYISPSDIDASAPVTDYGIDSMVAAELRNWLYGTLGVDVSLFELLDRGTSVGGLGEMVGGGGGGGEGEGEGDGGGEIVEAGSGDRGR